MTLAHKQCANMPITDAGGTRDTNVGLCSRGSRCLPMASVLPVGERRLRYVAVFQATRSVCGELNVRHKGNGRWVTRFLLSPVDPVFEFPLLAQRGHGRTSDPSAHSKPKRTFSGSVPAARSVPSRVDFAHAAARGGRRVLACAARSFPNASSATLSGRG